MKTELEYLAEALAKGNQTADVTVASFGQYVKRAIKAAAADQEAEAERLSKLVWDDETPAGGD